MIRRIARNSARKIGDTANALQENETKSKIVDQQEVARLATK